MLRRVLRAAMIVALGLGFSACHHRLSPEQIRANSLVFGGVNMDDAPGQATDVVFKIVRGKDTGQFFHLPVKDGVFYHEGIPPGSYQLYSVWAHTGLRIGNTFLFGNSIEYSFGAQSGGVIIQRGGTIYYAGAFKLVDKSSFFHSDVEVQPDRSKPVKQLLATLITHLDDEVVKGRAQAWYAKFP
jgi:hypothetical protein